MKREREDDSSNSTRMVPPSTPDKFPPPTAYGETIQIKVGESPGSKTLTVHKSILTFYSGYFEVALRPGSRFMEATTGVFNLIDEEVEIFEQFVSWCYSRRINCGSGSDVYLTICKLWVLADRREVPLLMNKCINELRKEFISLWISPSLILPYLYENTIAESTFRRLVVDLTARTCTSAILEAEGEEGFPKGALFDILKVVWQQDPDKRWTKKDVEHLRLCPEYHVHEEGVTCGKK